MLETYNNIRYFSVSPPSLDNIPRPENVLFETNDVNRSGDKNSRGTDCNDTVSNYGTSIETNTNIIQNSVTESNTDCSDTHQDSEKEQCLTRRDFVQDETRNITRSTKMLDSYDLDVKLQVKPKYYQKWARNKRSRSSIDALSIQPFSMLVRQQESAKSSTGKKDTLKRRRSTLKRRVNFERQLSSDNELTDKLFKRKRKVATRRSLQLLFTKNDSSTNLLDFADESDFESVDKDLNSEINLKVKNNCKNGQKVAPEVSGNKSAREKMLLAEADNDQPLCSVIQLKTETIPLIHREPIKPKPFKQGKEADNRLTLSENKVEEILYPRKDTCALYVRSKTDDVNSTLADGNVHVGVSNQNLGVDNKIMIDGSHFPQDSGNREHLGYHYPTRPIFNDLWKRREKQLMADMSEPVTDRKTETGTPVSLSIQGQKNYHPRGRVPVQLSKSSPRYSGPNNLFVDFETLRITAHLQKLEHYRNSTKAPLLLSPKRRFSSVTSPVQVIDRHGFKTVVLGYSVK